MPEYNFSIESLERFTALWREKARNLRSPHPFILPSWLSAWWRTFKQSGMTPCIFVMQNSRELAGIAPLVLRGSSAGFMGSENVCDYQDCIIAEGREQAFFNALIEHLRLHSATRLELSSLRPDSSTLSYLPDAAHAAGCTVYREAEDVSFELSLPSSWEDYLARLNGKQRHELRRKLRRLTESGESAYKTLEGADALGEALEQFFDFFRTSRVDKSEFMSQQMEHFFRTLACETAASGILKIGVLELEKKPVAALLLFDYNETVFLYNSGYDPRYRYLSVGLMSKILSVKEAIRRGLTTYDFLKGSEPYKNRLGAEPLTLSRLTIVLNG